MSIINSKSTNFSYYHEKLSYTSMTNPYNYLMHFPRLPITLPPFIPTFLSSRWNNDDDDDGDCEPVSRKPSHNHHYQYIRRRIPKRYSDIVGPSSAAKIFLSRKDSTNRERYNFYHHRSTNTNIHRHHSLKPINETIYYFNTSKKKSREIKEYHNYQTIKHNDQLAHRMQAAMSSELMNCLDRNFILTDRKHLVNHLLVPRSYSFNMCTTKNQKLERISSYQFIPRVKINLKKENIRMNEPVPDYDEQDDDEKEEDEVIIRTIQNEHDINEEPIIDYDDSRPIINSESDEKTMTNSDQAASSSFIVPQTSVDSIDEQNSIPPIPPPLPNLNIEQKTTTTFRCRTIADNLSSDHKLILKDEEENSIKPSERSQHHYIPVSKQLTLEKISQTLSRSQSLLCPISQANNHDKEIKSLIVDEQGQDGLSSLSSAPTTSIVNENENDYDHRSSSSKIYQEYKKRTSLTTINRNHSMLIHPMHTRIGLRSSTSSTTINEKLPDMTLSSKQMNVCVINQLNEHLSTRFSKQQMQNLSTNNNNNNNKTKTNHQSYDPPPELMSENNHINSNVYDEPTDLPVNNQICSSSIPPPPPPLPVGGFRPIPSSVNRSLNSQRTSIMTLPREANNSDMPIGGSTGTSTISSNLSDTRILRELRENPLFTRAKQHLEIEPGSNGRRSGGRRSNGSTINLPAHTDGVNNETVSYLRLDNCSKSTLKTSTELTNSKPLETIIMLPNELDAIIGKRTKSTNDINQVKSRPCIKSTSQIQCRKSELELIFQKRAQRSEQNLT